MDRKKLQELQQSAEANGHWETYFYVSTLLEDKKKYPEIPDKDEKKDDEDK